LSRKESVDVLRKKIDQIDEKVVALLNDRASLAQRIGQRKDLNNEEIYVPAREKQIYERVSRLSRGPLSPQAIRSIFREVVSASRSLEAPLRAVYLGPEATFTHLAAREKFGSSAALTPLGTIGEVFQEVSQGRVSFGVVPIENSTEGVVAHTLDELVESDVGICAELFLDIHHYLLSRTGRAEDIRRIVSHPQALAQCRSWLATHFPNAKLDEVGSTAQAALLAAVDTSLGAIASSLAKEFYDLEVVEPNIEDHGNNMTRFLVIGRHSAPPTGNDKTSLVFSVKDRPGILHRMLQPFAKSRINLTKIESRPIKGKPWEYMFFIDFQGHRDEAKTKRAIKKLEENCVLIKILGSYPTGT
jgi:chorismate mutase/prephenate dehydratase